MDAPLLRKPLYGGPFGCGEYELATQPIITSGLHAVRFMVIQLAAGQVVSIAEDKREALAAARHLLKKSVATQQPQPDWRQSELWPGIQLVPGTPLPAVSRRRREVFDRSGGACFYCRRRLSLHAFHVEHQRPRALGGDDAPLNLVAACWQCNLEKSDRTALEYMMKGILAQFPRSEWPELFEMSRGLESRTSSDSDRPGRLHALELLITRLKAS